MVDTSTGLCDFQELVGGKFLWLVVGLLAGQLFFYYGWFSEEKTLSECQAISPCKTSQQIV